jgi:hypothetical protein
LKLASDARVLSRRFSIASFSIVGSRFPHFKIACGVAEHVDEVVSRESAQLENGGVMLP